MSEETKDLQRFMPKLTAAQRNEIFAEYVAEKLPGEYWGWETRMAERYGVHRSTIHRITHDPKRMKKWLDGLNHAQNLAMGRILMNLNDAVGVQVDLIHDTTLPPNMLGLKQNAAVDLMNRAGLKQKDDNSKELKVSFTANGFTAAMPPAADDDEFD